MSAKTLPLSGYTIAKLYATHHELRPKNPDEEVEDHGALRFGWDWRWFDRTARLFEVRISVAVEPSGERPEYVATNVIGRFQQVEETPNVSLVEFSGVQAVAILLPYAREFLSSLTSNSVFGTYYLPTLNVNALMKDFNAEEVVTTQTEEDPPKGKGKGKSRHLQS